MLTLFPPSLPICVAPRLGCVDRNISESVKSHLMDCRTPLGVRGSKSEQRAEQFGVCAGRTPLGVRGSKYDMYLLI